MNDAIEIIRQAVVMVETQRELIDLYESQIADLVMMSKIELGDDVIAEIRRLKTKINEAENKAK